MILRSEEVKTATGAVTPKNLNAYLNKNSGYDGSGSIYWAKAGVSKSPVDLATTKSKIASGCHVILKVTSKTGSTHYVLATGYNSAT